MHRGAIPLLVLALRATAAARDPATAVYEHACAWCHGKDGRGDGPAAFSIGKYHAPSPRDFTSGRFRFRSTPSGQLPTDDDLLRTVERGVPNWMPSFAGLTPGERRLAITAVKRFYPAFATAHPTPILVPPPPPLDAAAAARGRRVYEEAGCASCHEGRVRNPWLPPILRDENGLPTRPPDLHLPSSFKNGTEPTDLYRTLVTGLDGTPMPSYATAFDDPTALWDLVAYLRSLWR